MSAASTSGTATLRGRLTTTVGREMLVGVTGLALVGFIAAHLAGNFLIFAGPEAINAYSRALHGLGELLWVARIGLITAFVVHIASAISLARNNRAARAQAYESVVHSGPKTAATRLMLLSGLVILFFLLFHLYDFTLRASAPPRSLVNGEDLGLYGVLWNSFANPARAGFYIAAMICLGMHLSHALSSVLVTLGILRDKSTPRVDRFARVIGVFTAAGFSSIPVYVLTKTFFLGGSN